MIIVYAMGGVGNQLFQYALYTYFSENRKNVYMDTYQFDTGLDPREWLLDDLTSDIRHAGTKERRRLLLDPYDNGCIYKHLRKYIGRNFFQYNEKKDAAFCDDVHLLRNAYIKGYWQSEKYFYPVRDKVISNIRFPEVPSEMEDLKVEIENSTSVSVHIRRGDYLSNPGFYGTLSETEYYDRAMELVAKKIPSPTFFVFSDDIEWCRERFANRDDVRFADTARIAEAKPYDDIHLMSLCKHNIIANSSFSWWAAYLNKNPNKITIAPKEWLKEKDTPDIWCDGWIRI